MPFPLLSFEGRIGRAAYAALSLPVFFSQHLAVWAALAVFREPFEPDLLFWVVPLRTLAGLGGGASALLFGGLVYLLIVAWILAALSFRRANDGAVSPWLASLAIAPFLQIPVIALLALAPPNSEQKAFVPRQEDLDAGLTEMALGVIAGMGLAVFAVALGALVFGSYGFGIFVLSPFFIGAAIGYLANRKGSLRPAQTFWLVTLGTVLGGVALVVAALEGVVCIILASPLGLGLALVGGAFGRAIALGTSSKVGPVYSTILILPLVFGIENILPPSVEFDTTQSIEIDAPADAVWRAVVHMDRMTEPRALPFRLGVAYPVRGDVEGEGVGATRRGEFSTGVALERVTEWEPKRKLAFVPTRDVPALRELSPYSTVHAPHVDGYFITRSTSFELVSLAGGRTKLIECTSHELRLEPILYWLPIARWAIDQNNSRVLAHIRTQAERSLSSSG